MTEKLPESGMDTLLRDSLNFLVEQSGGDDSINSTGTMNRTKSSGAKLFESDNSVVTVNDFGSIGFNRTRDFTSKQRVNNTSELPTLIGSGTVTNFSDTLITSFPVMDRTEDSVASFSIQEQVIMGAAITVGFLAILAVVLRIAMPLFRIRSTKRKQKPEIQMEDLYDEQPMDASGYVPYTLPMDSDQSQSSSQSDQSQSSTQSDWSDSSSNHTKSTYYSSDCHQMALWKGTSFGNLMGSTLSLPVCLPSESGRLTRSRSTEGLNASLMTALARKTYTEYSGSNILKHGPDSDRNPDISDDIASNQSLKTSYTDGSFPDGLLDRRSDGLPDRRVTELNPLFKQCYNNKYKTKLSGSKELLEQ